VVFGSMERFLGVLIEHYAGAFPVWLAPVQARVMNITDAQTDYVQDIARRLIDAGVRVETDTRNEKIGFKIREARLAMVPYMLVVGEKEKERNIVMVRDRSGEQKPATVEEFIAMVMADMPQI